MNTLLYVSILLVIAHLTPPAGIVQLAEPGFETPEECHAWLEIDENRDEIMQNILINFGPWADIKAVACLTEKAVQDLNEKWGHKSLEDSPAPNDFLKQFEGGGA